MTRVWATTGKRKSDDSYNYKYYAGKRPTERSFMVGEIDNKNTYRGNGRYPQPSFAQVIRMGG